MCQETEVASQKDVTLQFCCGPGCNVEKAQKIAPGASASPFRDVCRDRDGGFPHLGNMPIAFRNRHSGGQ